MKIAVNTRFLLPHKLEGIGWFTYEIFQQLTRQHPEVEWLFIFDRPYRGNFIFSDNITPIVVSPQARHPFLWYIWFEINLPKVFKKHKPDLFISPDGYLSLNSNVKSLAVIHDLNFEHSRENIPRLAGNYYRNFFPKFARKASRIATVSQFSKEDIIQQYQIEESKIDIVYNGCGDFFFPLSGEEKAAVQRDMSDSIPYFIFIGALNPRKNISGMLQAFEIYKDQGGKNKFLIVGEKMFWSKDIAKCYENHAYKNDIIFTGRLEGQGLNRVLGGSEALLFVSHFEGFGIPIIEAFKCEIPVITSTTTSMPEVAGDAAILCDPLDLAGIANAMHNTDNPELRKTLIQKGRKRAALFTWQRSADMMWNSIQKTLGQ